MWTEPIKILTKLAANVAETSPYALDRSSVVVTSATYAKTTENVTANTPLIEIIAKNHHVFIVISGIGAHVKNTVISRKNFLPQTSDRAPISGALRNERMPLMPITRPFIRNVWSGNVWLRTCKWKWMKAKSVENWWRSRLFLESCTHGDDGHR